MIWPSAISMAVETIRGAEYLSDEQKRAILFENAVEFLGIEEERQRLIAAACSRADGVGGV